MSILKKMFLVLLSSLQSSLYAILLCTVQLVNICSLRCIMHVIIIYFVNGILIDHIRTKGFTVSAYKVKPTNASGKYNIFLSIFGNH